MTASTGSTFYSYDEPSKVYSKTRKAVGGDLLLEKLRAMEGEGRTVKDMKVLDGGAGTGNYATWVAQKVGKVTAFEYNDGMIATMKQRAAEAGVENLEIVQGSLFDKLPFEDGTFDLVIMNQVVHHLDAIDGTAKEGFPMNKHVAAEYHRVLRPGGHVAINFTTPRQNVEGWWWSTSLLRDAATAFTARMPCDKTLNDHYAAAGFKDIQLIPILEPLQGESHYEASALLDPLIRDGDSLFGTVPKEELDAALKKVEGLIAAGEDKAFVEQHSKWGKENGQSTTLVGRK